MSGSASLAPVSVMRIDERSVIAPQLSMPVLPAWSRPRTHTSVVVSGARSMRKSSRSAGSSVKSTYWPPFTWYMNTSAPLSVEGATTRSSTRLACTVAAAGRSTGLLGTVESS